jgi:hypothetical protein
LLGFAASCSLFEHEVRVPVLPTPCRIPAFHVQKDCGGDLPCLIGEFALTLQDEHAALDALKACPMVHLG